MLAGQDGQLMTGRERSCSAGIRNYQLDIVLFDQIAGVAGRLTISNQIRDISHLSELTALKELRLGNNNINDTDTLSNLSSLSNLIHLKILELNDTKSVISHL